MKQFVFLYPADRKFKHLIKNASYPPPEWLQDEVIGSRLDFVKDKQEKEIIIRECLDESIIRFNEFYKRWFNNKLNDYRYKGFGINWFVYNGESVSDIVNLETSDNIFEVGVSWNLHQRKKVYPCQSFMLEKIQGRNLVIAGFNFSDCVQRFSNKAIQQKRNVSIDENLTDLAMYRRYLFEDYFQLHSKVL